MKSLIIASCIFLVFSSCMSKSTAVVAGQGIIEKIETSSTSTTSTSTTSTSTTSTSTTSTTICVAGKRLALWLDEDNDKVEDTKQGTFISYSGDLSAAKNYNYFSASAHPEIGPEPSGFKSTVYFYEGSDGLTMFFFHNVDNGGSAENKVHWSIEVEGNNLKDTVLVSDDPKHNREGFEKDRTELKLIETVDDKNIYDADFLYFKNTDGGVIGPLEGENFKIYVKNLGAGDIEDSKFYSLDGNDLNLASKNGKVNSFIIKYESFEDCK